MESSWHAPVYSIGAAVLLLLLLVSAVIGLIAWSRSGRRGDE